MSWVVTGLEHVRAEFVMIAREADSCMAAACREFGISRKTGYKWLHRYESDGLPGLADRSRRPRSSPLRLSGEIVVALVGLHAEHPSWGPKKLRACLPRVGVSRDELPGLATVARLSRRLGWSDTKGRGRPRRALPVGRLSGAGQPNDVWTVDFKGWWRTQDGRRCEPLSIRDLYSRYILCLRPLVWRKTAAVQAAFAEVFERYGLPGIIRSDNGAPFASLTGPHGLTRLSAWWRSLGIRLERIGPGHPEQNGGHERMHRDVAAEIEGRPAATVEAEARRLERWRRAYNLERPHEALGMRTPGEVYRRSARRLAAVRRYAYPPSYERRRVQTDGWILVQGRYVYLSGALAKQDVGLEWLSETSWRVWFCDLPISELALTEHGIVRRQVNSNCNPCPDNKVSPMS
jgi:transposase InsO family protein